MNREDRSASTIELGAGAHIAAEHLRFQFARSGGPGGQNVNKVNTKAELWVEPGRIAGLTEAAQARLLVLSASHLTMDGTIHLVSQEHRSQERNRQQVIDKLRELVLRATVEKKRRRKTGPSAGARQRRMESKRKRSEIKSSRQNRPE